MSATRQSLRNARQRLPTPTAATSAQPKRKHQTGQKREAKVSRLKGADKDGTVDTNASRAPRTDSSRKGPSVWSCKRCDWSSYVGTSSLDAYLHYHDTEWGVPLGWPSPEDDKLFEMLSLEGAQAGLSWATILRKRKAYKAVFANFEIDELVKWGEKDVARILSSTEKTEGESIVKNTAKVTSVINNAKHANRLAAEHGSFSAYIWSFVGGRPIENSYKTMKEVPTQDGNAEALSKALKKEGFKFVGPVICYSFMQAVGMVNDHTTDCYRHADVRRLVDKSKHAKYELRVE
mmetsp:Transcript_11252/g.41206  ORF Transcript_11252/g.41206 Transcript_11252/m.41206 type:complete len:291 (-) Transcript_11252:133-1005(-)